MKKYYQTLDKEKKDKIKEIYKKEYQKSEVDVRLKRLNIYIILAFLASIALIVLSLLYEDGHVTSFIMAGILIAIGIIFIIGKRMIKINLLNKIALNNKKEIK